MSRQREEQKQMESNVEIIKSSRIYSGNISLRKDKFRIGSRIVEKEIVEHRPSVGMVPVIGDDLVLVIQYRHAAGRALLEIPAGKIEQGETPEQAAFREMEEETGHTVGNLIPLIGWFMVPGYATEFMHLFVATDLTKSTKPQNMDDDEDIAIRKVSLDSAVADCIAGKIADCKTVAAILAYNALRAKLR
jgi:ADP-ribose pyrophosphatase